MLLGLIFRIFRFNSRFYIHDQLDGANESRILDTSQMDYIETNSPIQMLDGFWYEVKIVDKMSYQMASRSEYHAFVSFQGKLYKYTTSQLGYSDTSDLVIHPILFERKTKDVISYYYLVRTHKVLQATHHPIKITTVFGENQIIYTSRVPKFLREYARVSYSSEGGVKNYDFYTIGQLDSIIECDGTFFLK